MIDAKFSSLIVAAYDAGSDPSLWPIFFKQYSDFVPADFIGIQTHNFVKRYSNFHSLYGEATTTSESYHRYYTKLNLWRERGKHLFRHGQIVPTEQHTPLDVLLRSEFYNDYLRPAKLAHSLSGIISRDEELSTGFSVTRGTDAGAFTREELEITTALLPHITRAFDIQQRLETLAAGEDVLNRLSLGVIFMESKGRIVFANRFAETILQAKDGLELQNNELRANHSTCDEFLQRAIREARALGETLRSSNALLLERRTMHRPYQVIVSPVRRQFKQFSGARSPAVVILVTDPERPGSAPPDILMALYGLTRKEAVLTQRLLYGRTLEEIADELHITYETARTHLRRIFDKTGTKKQTELIVLLARIPAFF